MPEEINRLVTDVLADILWTPSPDADENLTREGIPAVKIQRVGNIMIDSLEMMRDTIESQDTYREFGLQAGGYGVVTLHRPSNVDEPSVLKSLIRSLRAIGERIPLVFPVHPRTRKNLIDFGLLDHSRDDGRGLVLVEPLSYVRFMNLVFHCRFAITDSGGIQEETTYLGIPCFTMRPNTERPITIQQGTNRLCTLEGLESQVEAVFSEQGRKHGIPEYWDGHTAERVVHCISHRQDLQD